MKQWSSSKVHFKNDNNNMKNIQKCCLFGFEVFSSKKNSAHKCILGKGEKPRHRSVSVAYLEEVHEAVEVGVETVEPAAVEKRLIGQQPV